MVAVSLKKREGGAPPAARAAAPQRTPRRHSVAGTLPGFDGIVVMPAGGRAGWYSDWPGRTDGNFAPLWETFHVHQLVPWVDANFNTSGTRSGRAVAGLSMGGYGALRYAGRHPHLFSAVGAFSAGTTSG